jgi:hypothetical protein
MRDARDGGFTLVELLVSAAITLTITGVALVMVSQGRSALDQGAMGLEAAQRLRAGLDVLARDLRAAGAGPEADSGALAMVHAMPVVELRRSPRSLPVERGAFDSVRVTAAPVGGAHGRLASRAVPGGPIVLRGPPECPALPACGFREGASAVVYDGSGAFDAVVVTGIDSASGAVVVSPALSREYPVDALIAEVVLSTFLVDTETDGAGRLMRQTAAGAVQPIVDHLVRFSVQAFGEALPPSAGRTPRSPPTYGPTPPPPEVDDPRDTWPAGENCTIERGAGGVPAARLPPLGGAGQLVEIGPSQLQDGPWCLGASGAPYDADLFRIRRLDVRLRVEASSARLRGPAGPMFARGGHGQSASWVPDLEMRLSVSPPNLGRR